MPCHVTGRIHLVLKPGHLPDQRGGLVTSEGTSLTGRSSVPETHGFQFFRNWQKVGRRFLFWGKSPGDFACLFFGKTKKKRLVVSLHLFFLGDFFPSTNPCFWGTSCRMRCEVGAFFALSGYVAVPFLVQMGR